MRRRRIDLKTSSAVSVHPRSVVLHTRRPLARAPQIPAASHTIWSETLLIKTASLSLFLFLCGNCAIWILESRCQYIHITEKPDSIAPLYVILGNRTRFGPVWFPSQKQYILFAHCSDCLLCSLLSIPRRILDSRIACSVRSIAGRAREPAMVAADSRESRQPASQPSQPVSLSQSVIVVLLARFASYHHLQFHSLTVTFKTSNNKASPPHSTAKTF